MTNRPELDALLARAKERWDAMTEQERDAMIAEQRASWVRGEMAMGKPRYRWVDGVKVYESYGDYVRG